MNLRRFKDAKALPWLAAALAALLALAVAGGGSEGGTATSEERRIAEVLSAMEGAGKVEVALFYATAQDGLGARGGAPTGAVVVAQGAGDLSVRLRLTRAVRTLLGLPETAVDVFVMEEDAR